MLLVKLSDGNQKVGKCPNVSLTPIKACGNCTQCAKNCYALKSYRMYREVRAAWDGNLQLARGDRAHYFSQISEQLSKRRKPPRYFRWHVSGDILDQNYFDHMCGIAVRHSRTKFLVFTKMHALDFSRAPKNLRVVLSMWPGMPLPTQQLPRAWMQDGTETRVPQDAITCPGLCEDCHACWGLKCDVVFNKH